jgi:hypothetical protein
MPALISQLAPPSWLSNKDPGIAPRIKDPIALAAGDDPDPLERLTATLGKPPTAWTRSIVRQIAPVVSRAASGRLATSTGASMAGPYRVGPGPGAFGRGAGVERVLISSR